MPPCAARWFTGRKKKKVLLKKTGGSTLKLWVTLELGGCRVPSSIMSSDYYLCGVLQVLPEFVWVSSKFSDFLPPPKDLLESWLASVDRPWVWVCVQLCAHFCLAKSVPRIGSGCTVNLALKQLLKMLMFGRIILCLNKTIQHLHMFKLKISLTAFVALLIYTFSLNKKYQ